MNPTTLSRLLELNRQFYQTFALQFSATRQRLQPGVKRHPGGDQTPAKVLDLGCGNGELARQLARRVIPASTPGWTSRQNCLGKPVAAQSPNYHFLQADLSTPDWDAPLSGMQYDCILAFAVLHHLPGADLRLQVLRKVRSLLAPEDASSTRVAVPQQPAPQKPDTALGSNRLIRE